MTPYKLFGYGAALVLGVWALVYILVTFFWIITRQESKRWILKNLRRMEDVDPIVPTALKHLWKLHFGATATQEGSFRIDYLHEIFWIHFGRVALESVRSFEITVRDAYGYIIYQAKSPHDWNVLNQQFDALPMNEDRYHAFLGALKVYAWDQSTKLRSSWF